MNKDIYIYTADRTEGIKLPIPPQELIIKRPWKNEIYESITYGELKNIGLEGLQSVAISSYFPSKNYRFRRDNAYNDMEYVTIIQRWRETKKPIRLIIPSINLNLPIVMDEFEYGFKDATGDVYYTMQISEWRSVL